MLPWNLLKSSNSFTSYLSAYSVFLSSIAGVMVGPDRLSFPSAGRLLIRPFHLDHRILLRSEGALPCCGPVQPSQRRVVLLHVRRKPSVRSRASSTFMSVPSKQVLNDFLCRGYAAYVAGILINVVGFAGASK